MSATLTSLLVAGFIVGVFAAVGIGLFLATALKKTGFESPEAAFAAHQEALHEKQWDKLILTYTPANQKELAFAVSYLAAEEYPRSDEVKQALQDNGLMTNLNPKSLPERETAHRNFSVSDDASCFAEMVEAYDTAAADRITNPVLRAIFRKSKGERIRERSGGALRDLQMTGDTATATIFLVIEDDEEIEDSVTFRQIDGRWFIHLDDDELHSHYFLGMNPLF
jgi:hypothetical protein